MNRKIETDLDNILDLIACADDYGHNNQVLMVSLAEITGYVTDKEINDYAAWYLTDEGRADGYSEEDVDSTTESLKNWRNRYCAQWEKPE